LLTALVDGGHVALITDAGMPSVSDPGYRLVAVAVAHQVRVTVVPGPSAVTAALAVSGLPVDRFCFEGFLPRTRGARRAALQALRHEPRTMVFFEAPHRLRACLSDMSDVWGAGHSAVVCRELTKTHEEVVRGSLGELCEWSASGVRGEVTVVVRGALAPTSDSSDEWVARVDALVAGGLSTRDAVTQAAEELAVSRRSVYQAVMAARGTPHQPT
jgi:16S rRNA (cytidine1402-2'-O)-methyltransferase